MKKDQPFQAIWTQAKQTISAPNMFVSDCKYRKEKGEMGYRSDVTITLYKQDFETLVRQASENTNGAVDLIKYASLYKNEASDIITLFWNSVKWYDDYNDVDFIMSFIRSGDVKYHYLRVGEESGDIEEENNDHDRCLCESTYIEQYICIESAVDEVNIESSVDEILKQTIPEDVDDDNIAEVSESELLDVISA